MLLLGALAALPACRLRVPSCGVRCEPDGRCAIGRCGSDGYCHDDLAEASCAGAPGDGGASGDAAMASGVAYNLAFVSSTTYAPGSLAGHGMSALAFADQECNRLAAAATPKALPGRFVAWLSDSTHDAAARLVTSGGQASRGWVRTDGRPFVDTTAMLISGQIYFPLRLDESGRDLVGPEVVPVATGTNPDGKRAAATASDWSSLGAAWVGGNATATTESWTEGIQTNNFSTAHVYCFAVDRVEPLQVVATTGRQAFLSATGKAPGVGWDPDAACRGDAATRGLPRADTFLALVSTGSVAAAARFGDGPPWVRLDGVPWVLSLADLGSGASLTPLNLDSTGRYLGFATVWTGSNLPRETATNHCGGWSSMSLSGIAGRADMSGPWSFNDVPTNDCTDAARFYCLEP